MTCELVYYIFSYFYRERRISERDSPSDRKEDDEDNPVQDACVLDIDKPHGNIINPYI